MKKCLKCGKTWGDKFVHCPECGEVLATIKKKKVDYKIPFFALCGAFALSVLIFILVIVNINNENAHTKDRLDFYIEHAEKQSDYTDMLTELDWFMNNAVFVTKSGECYHKRCCQYVQDAEIYIYNIENAEAKGYRPCSVCFSSTYDWKAHI